jgi:hypothetical protein
MSVEFGKTGVNNILAFGASKSIACKGHMIEAVFVRVAGVIYVTRECVFYAAVHMMIRWNGVTLSQSRKTHRKTVGMCVSVKGSWGV